jgi:phosphohistidine phosphatase SixA
MRAFRLLSFLFALVLAAPWGSAGAEAALAPGEAVALLRRGGLILYFRHTATDFSQNDANMKSFEDCASQRNLTDRGRADARTIGTAIRALAIPVGKVRASPFCRTVETAELAFGRAEKTVEVRGGSARADDPARYAQLRKLLSQPPARGTNDVIVSHGNPFHAVAGPPYLAEGEAAVVQPDASGKNAEFRVIARIRVEEWPAPR